MSTVITPAPIAPSSASSETAGFLVTTQADPDRGDAFYTRFYADGGWRYGFLREWWWLRRNVVKRFGLVRGMRVLEVACGAGFHTHVLNRMGFHCIGVDRNRAAIDWAQRKHPRWTYHCADLADLLPDHAGAFDAVLARGCSHYHYDLASAQALETTGTLLRYLKPGGAFIMAIATDLSGRRPDGKIWNNTLDDYRRHFGSFGLRYDVAWVKGMAVCGIFAPGGTVKDR